ncbi:Ada metal-binding domain-containing protein [Spirosoma radiotolerans]|uniref:Metal-binding protein n=1 Tax=Spirosoma radiotolerans TaxID=1379870 RepID=A0A0E3ZTD5_9BACT|nr:Ada metal-binding domain-containing protein [Spirosoma radiotolerans]AKD54560.1 metal-binding protein [Spirosoma radiotolerans]
MIRHVELGATPISRLRTLSALVGIGRVSLGGNRPGKIYGLLTCRAGKRMNVANRVFFSDEAEAILAGFRPCAVCLPAQYKAWQREQ